jgi:hypothetical protein
MDQKNTLTKVLAIGGTILVWLPILAPILLSLLPLIAERRFRFDYLMPMELFMFALAGSGLLLWATLRAHARVKFVAGGIGLAIFMFFGAQAFAVFTGLASGETEPVGWMWGIVIASLILYALGIILVGTGGALLLKDLFKSRLSAG